MLYQSAMNNLALARRGHLVCLVALLLVGAVVVGCGSSLKPGGGTGGAGGGGGATGSGGVGGSSACSPSNFPASICCLPSDHDPLVKPYVCDSTGTWVCPLGYFASPPATCIINTSTGGTVGAGGSGSGGIGGSAGGAGGTGGAGGLSGHSGTNGSCGPVNNGQGGSECGMEGITCCNDGACNQGLRCISGDTCARECGIDGGVSCRPSTTCQTTSACCVGTACSAVQVTVCL